MIDVSVFESISKIHPMELSPVTERFILADGSDLAVMGEVDVELQIGEQLLLVTMVVAELGDDYNAILGLNFMEEQDVILRVSHGKMMIGNETVPLHRENAGKGCCRISMGKTLTIPPRSCRVVEAEVDMGKSVDSKWMHEDCILECLPTLAETSGVMMGSEIVKIHDRKVPVNLINVHDRPLCVFKGRTLGSLQPVKTVSLIQPGDDAVRDKSRRKSSKLVTLNDIPEHTRAVLDGAEDLTAEQESDVCEIVLEDPDRFVGPDGRTGNTDWAEHGVDVQGAPPVKISYHGVPLSKQKVAGEQIDKMLAHGVIEPSNSPWSFPTVLVTKKDGSIRFCVDYRKLNALSRKDAYPLPRIDETLNTLGGAQWFCTMDLASGYWQIKMKEEDKPKTAFMTRKGLFQFRVMPFGLSNAPATFQRLMDHVLRGLQWEKCLVYLDDIIIFGKTFDETLGNLRCVMKRLKSAGLKLKASKCQWFRKSVKYLGHIVSAEGVACDPEKIEAVQSWPVPCTVTQVRQFLGFASYYRKFIPNFSAIAKPLTNLTKKSVRFAWTNQCQNAFENLKAKLVSAPVLAYPQAEGQYILDTDASNYAVGAVLSQIQDGEERVIAYASKALHGGQENYCTTKKELFAAVTFVEHFRYYLSGNHFVIRTDHASLKWLRNFKNIDGMLARWLATLEKYNYEIVHRKGPQHQNADALSRIPVRKCPRDDCPQCTLKVCPITALPAPAADDADEWLEGWTERELYDWQRADPVLAKIITWLETSPERPKSAAAFNWRTKSYLNQWDALFLNEKDILCRKWYPQGKGTHGQEVRQIVAPKEVRNRILATLHNSPTGAHLGQNKTLNKVRYRFYWTGYKEQVIRWCRRCDVCAQSKPGPKRTRAQLGRVPVAAPLERIAVDIMGPIPETDDGNKYILVLGDYFSKWTEAYALKNHTAQTVADIIMEQFISRFGIPRSLHSDQGPEFESDLIAELCKLLHINKTRTVPYNPKSDGLVERANRTVIQMLKTLVNEARNDWDDLLPFVMMAYRSSVHESTKCTPNLLMLNHEINLPIDLMIGAPPETPACPVQYVEWVRDAAEHAFGFVQRNLKTSAERQKKLNDRKSGSPKFKIGDSVWRYSPPRAKLKFGKGWEGPYLVVRRVNPLCYKIQKGQNSRSIVVHVDHLKLYEGSKPVKSWLRAHLESHVGEDAGASGLGLGSGQEGPDTDAVAPVLDKDPPSNSDLDETVPFGDDIPKEDPGQVINQPVIGVPDVPENNLDEIIPSGSDDKETCNHDADASTEDLPNDDEGSDLDQFIPNQPERDQNTKTSLTTNPPMSNSPDTVLNTNQTDAEASGGSKELSSESSEGSQVSGMNKQGLNLDPANTPELSLTSNQDLLPSSSQPPNPGSTDDSLPLALRRARRKPKPRDILDL